MKHIPVLFLVGSLIYVHFGSIVHACLTCPYKGDTRYASESSESQPFKYFYGYTFPENEKAVSGIECMEFGTPPKIPNGIEHWWYCRNHEFTNLNCGVEQPADILQIKADYKFSWSALHKWNKRTSKFEYTYIYGCETYDTEDYNQGLWTLDNQNMSSTIQIIDNNYKARQEGLFANAGSDLKGACVCPQNCTYATKCNRIIEEMNSDYIGYAYVAYLVIIVCLLILLYLLYLKRSSKNTIVPSIS